MEMEHKTMHFVKAKVMKCSKGEGHPTIDNVCRLCKE